MVQSLLSILLASLITLSGSFLITPPAWTSSLGLRAQPIAVLPGFQGVFTGTPPENIGVHDGQLAPCPSTPNCVVSQQADGEHAIAPIRYQRDRDTAREILLKILTRVPRTEVVTQTDDYILIKSASKLLGFVDDAEFYFPPDQKVIHLRSAARLGESDLGVNRRRLEQIRLAMQELGA